MSKEEKFETEEGEFSELRWKLLEAMLNEARNTGSKGVRQSIMTNLLLIGILGELKDDNDPCWQQLWVAWGGGGA